MKRFEGKLALLQRVAPGYRAPFFQALAARCSGGLTLLTGRPLPVESIRPVEKLDGVRYHQISNRQIFHPRHPLYLCFQTGVPAWLETEAPDALVVEANPRYLSTRAAIKHMQALGKPVLGWGLGAPPLPGTMAGWRMNARTRLVGSLDGIIAYSRRGALEYELLGVIPPERIFVAHNAVAPPPQTPAPVRGPLQHPLNILFVGRLQARKKLEMLFEACARIPEPLQPSLTVVGDGPARGLFEETAARVYPRTRFTGERFGESLKAEFAAADLFVLPGTGGLAVQEAMSHALPVIVAAGDGTQADLVRPANGWQVPPDNIDALTAALHTALKDPDLRAKGAFSRKIVADEINIEQMADRFIEAIQQVARS